MQTRNALEPATVHTPAHRSAAISAASVKKPPARKISPAVGPAQKARARLPAAPHPTGSNRRSLELALPLEPGAAFAGYVFVGVGVREEAAEVGVQPPLPLLPLHVGAPPRSRVRDDDEGCDERGQGGKAGEEEIQIMGGSSGSPV